MALTKKQKDFLKVLEDCLGIVTLAAKKFGISPWSHYDWCKRSEEYAEEAAKARSRADDFAESKLFDAIKDGDTAAIIFYCKTRLKHRGYTERTDVDITTGGKPLDNHYIVEIINNTDQIDRKEERDE